MAITVKYFARLREALRTSEESLALSPTWPTIGALRQALAARGEPWGALLGADIQCARNGELASDDTPLTDCDEIAFFPPVTGG